MKTEFKLDAHDCALIAALEERSSLTELSRFLGRDPSVLSRQLNKIVSRFPLAEKTSGKWKLTATGKRVAEWFKKASFEQAALLNKKTLIRLGSTREFSARVIAPQLKEIRRQCDTANFSLYSFEDGVEQQLLNGTIDIGIDCGRPNDPQIVFKRLVPEPLVIVACPEFWQKNSVRSLEDLQSLPYFWYSRINLERTLEFRESLATPLCSFNDVASLREALVREDNAWALLPRYTIKRELALNLLSEFSLESSRQESFGIWHLRARSDLKCVVALLEEWLKKQRL